MLRRLVLVACACLVIVGCSSAPPAGTLGPAASGSPAPTFAQVVTSPDGSATLAIPAGALPAGVAASSITVANYALPDSFADTRLLAAYTLGPDATSFVTPLTLTIHLQAGVTFPELASISGDSVELLPTSVEIDPETNMVAVSAPIKHFSSVVAYAGNVRAELTDPGDHAVGPPFPMTVKLSRVLESRLVQMNETVGSALDQTISKFVNFISNTETFGPVSFDDGYLAADVGASGISPRSVDLPASALSVEDDVLSLSANFQCTVESPLLFRYGVSAHQAFRINLPHFITQHPDVPDVLLLGVSTHKYRCLAAAPTPTASPTPTPTVAATASPIALESLPVSNISGICFNLVDGSPPSLIFTLYSYDLPVDHMIITIDGVNGGSPTSLTFNASVDGWKDVPFQVTGTGAGKIRSVIFVQPDGTQLDVTKPFTTVLGTDTIDLDKTGGTGPICQHR